MSFFSSAKAKLAASKLAEERLYALAHEELESGEVRKGLWAKALAESDGDKARAEGRYLKLRVEAMKSEASLEAHQEKQASTNPKVRKTPWEIISGFTRRHWAGELPLWVSFWFVSQVLGVVVGIIYLALDDMFWDAPATGIFGVRYYAAMCSILILCLVPFVAWQSIGVWRSASRYVAEGRRRFFPYAAKLLLLLSLPTLYSSVYIGSNAVGEYFKLALVGPETSGIEIEIKRNAFDELFNLPPSPKAPSRLIITGPIEFGDVSKVKKLLGTVPLRKKNDVVVHLDSPGGNLEVAYRISRLLSRLNVDTRVVQGSKCESACTVLFLAGRHRSANGSSPLGFHSASHNSGNNRLKDLANSELREFYLTRGMAESCIDIALSTSPEDMWYPKLEEYKSCGLTKSAIVFTPGIFDDDYIEE